MKTVSRMCVNREYRVQIDRVGTTKRIALAPVTDWTL